MSNETETPTSEAVTADPAVPASASDEPTAVARHARRRAVRSPEPSVGRPGRPGWRALLGNALLVLLAGLVLASDGYRSRTLTTNIDGVSYMSIARQIATGHLADAVNGYWSPLVSWLMAPFVAAGAGLTTAFMAVTVLTSVAVLAVGAWLVLRTTGNGWLAALVTATTASLLLANVARETPDLLVVLWFVLFVWALTHADAVWGTTTRRMVTAGVALGAVCAFGYFAKLYTVPVTVVVVAVWLVLRVRRSARERPERPGPDAHRSRVLLLPAAALATLVVLTAPWVVALSLKYDGPTLGSSFGVNISGKFDAASTDLGDDYVVPVPPNATAVSPAEDRTPSVYQDNALTAPRTTDSSSSNDDDDDDETTGSTLGEKAQYYLSERIAAFPFYLRRIGSFAAFAVPIGVLFGAAALTGLVRYRTRPAVSLVALTTAVYAAGYAAITSAQTQGGNSRYYLPLMTGTLLMAVALLPSVWRGVTRPGIVRKVLVVVACLAAVTASFTQNVLGQPAPFSIVVTGPSGAPPLDVLGPTRTPSDAAFVTKLRATGAIPEGSAILGDNARETVNIAWRLDAQAYGRSGEGYDFTDPSFVTLMRDAGIDRFLHFSPVDDPVPDYSGVGVLRASVRTDSACDVDDKLAEDVKCRVDVVEVTR